MPVYHLQNVLNGGEITPLMRGRVDQPRYQTGAQTMHNMVPMPQGGVTRRPGTRFLGMASGDRCRFIPFVFSATQGRMLEFGDHVMHVWLPDGTQVDKSFASPFAAADLAAIRYAQSADVIYFAHPDYAPCKLSRHADDDWRFASLLFLPGIAAPTGLSGSIVDRGANNGSATRTYTYVVTAVDEETGQESSASAEFSITAKSLDSMEYIIRLTWAPSAGASYYRIYKKKHGMFGYIGRADSAGGGEIAGLKMGALTCGISKFAGSITRTVVNGNGHVASTDSTGKLSVAASASQNAFIIGGQAFVRVTKTTKTTTWVHLLSGWQDSTTTSESYFWIMIPCEDDDPSGTYSSYTTGQLGNNAAYPSGIVGSYSVTPIFDGSKGTFDDENIGADTTDTPPEHENPFADGNYPSQVFFHQQRLGFAASNKKPITIWLSRTGDFEIMASSTPPRDDDAITATLASTQANRIVWLQPDRQAMAFGTEGSEWTLKASEGVALTPSNISFELQTTIGGDDAVQAMSVGGAVLFVQRGSKSVRQLAYNYSADKYLPQDLNLLARHVLADTNIVAWAYQQEPHSSIWCVLADGSMAGLTYMPEHEVVGWHRHTTEGQIRDVAAIPGTPDDQVWLLVERPCGLCVERFETFFDSDNLTDANFLDSALRYDGPPKAEFFGLDHLAGQTVQAFADGSTIDALTVGADGSLVLPRPASSVLVGLPAHSRLALNLPEVNTQKGSSVLKGRKVSGVRFRVYRSMSFQAGFGVHLHPVIDRQIRGGSFQTTPFYTEGTDLHMETCAGWTDTTPLTIEVCTPTPLTILSILTAMDIAPFSGKGGN